MSIIYYIEFAKENNRFNIEKTSIESILQEFEDYQFKEKHLDEILDLINYSNLYNQNEVILFILSDYLNQIPDFVNWMNNYLFTYKGKDFLNDKLSRLKSYKMKPYQLIEIFDNVISKLNLKHDEKLDKKNDHREIQKEDGIVIDCGSSYTRVGIIGEEEPLIIIPTKVAQINNDTRPSKLWVNPMTNVNIQGNNTYYYGDEIQEGKNYNIYYPVKNGSINIEYLEMFIRYLLIKKLKIDPKDHILLISFPYFFFENKALHDEILRFFLDVLKFPSICISDSSVLSLCACAITTGFSVDIGYENTRFCPVYDGHVIPFFSSNVNFGGNDISIALKKQLNNSNINDDIVEDIKKNHCFVSSDDYYDTNSSENRDFTLPNNDTITLSTERFSCCETLFKNDKFEGIAKKIYDTISKIDKDFQKEFYSDIVISGGTSSLPGIKYRIEKELKKLTNNREKINVIVSSSNENSVWVGGSIFGSLASFPQLVVTKQEYDDLGPLVFRRFI